MVNHTNLVHHDLSDTKHFDSLSIIPQSQCKHHHKIPVKQTVMEKRRRSRGDVYGCFV